MFLNIYHCACSETVVTQKLAIAVVLGDIDLLLTS